MRVPSSARIRTETSKEGPDIGPKKVLGAARVKNDADSNHGPDGLQKHETSVVLNPRTSRLVTQDNQAAQERADRVQAVKAEFQGGKYQIDFDQLSDGLLEQDKEALGL